MLPSEIMVISNSPTERVSIYFTVAKVMNRMLSVGVVGEGNITTRHLENLKFLRGNRVMGLCDIAEDLVCAKAATFGTKAYSEWERRLDEEPSLDALLICTPPTIRKEIIEAAADRTIPFYTRSKHPLSAGTPSKFSRLINPHCLNRRREGGHFSIFWDNGIK